MNNYEELPNDVETELANFHANPSSRERDCDEPDEKRLFPDNLDLGELSGMDFTACEGMLMCLRQIMERLPRETFENLPGRWASIFVDGMDDIRELRKIAGIQLRKSEEAQKEKPTQIWS